MERIPGGRPGFYDTFLDIFRDRWVTIKFQNTYVLFKNCQNPDKSAQRNHNLDQIWWKRQIPYSKRSRWEFSEIKSFTNLIIRDLEKMSIYFIFLFKLAMERNMKNLHNFFFSRKFPDIFAVFHLDIPKVDCYFYWYPRL